MTATKSVVNFAKDNWQKELEALPSHIVRNLLIEFEITRREEENWNNEDFDDDCDPEEELWKGLGSPKPKEEGEECDQEEGNSNVTSSSLNYEEVVEEIFYLGKDFDDNFDECLDLPELQELTIEEEIRSMSLNAFLREEEEFYAVTY
ncbi:MAG: hypothetical protein LBE20_01340 [Deltaproteobacteria bacterium]|jgi:hypothetical protein|nr:hypothetical protein [Deltaproteobacteria bacterium]